MGCCCGSSPRRRSSRSPSSRIWSRRSRSAGSGSDETPPHPDTRRPLRTEIAEGLRFVVHEPYLRRIVACTSLANFASAVAGAVLVIYVLRTLGLGTAAYGAIMSASAIGGLLGAVVAGRLAQWVGEGRIIPLSALGVGSRRGAGPAGRRPA